MTFMQQKMGSRLLLTILLPLLFGACQPNANEEQPLSITQDVVAAASFIQASDIRADVVELSSDAYEGRGPGTEGDRKPQTYLISRLKEMGLQPGAADNSWRQEFELIALNAQQPDTW